MSSVASGEAVPPKTFSAGGPAPRLATRLVFFIAGFAVACWAPLVPFVKERTGATEASLGLLLLCLGMGSVTVMPLAGGLAGRVGSRAVILAGVVGAAVALPLLATATWMPLLVAALLLFGASVGAVDVAVNIHGTEVQEAAGVPLMSNFHGMYSVGGLAGSAGMTAALSLGASPGMAVGISVVLILACMAMAAPRLLRSKSRADTPFLVRPRGVVLLIGLLACSMFLVEGAMLDWSAVFLKEQRGFDAGHAGSGFVIFSLAMTVGRLAGDKITHLLGGQKVLLIGSLVTALGLAILVLAPWTAAGLVAFALIGSGAANLVPVLFTAAGNQKIMPAELAIAGVSVLGYLGVLVGPAAIGFIAKSAGLNGAFLLLIPLPLFVAAMCWIGKEHPDQRADG